MRAARAEVLKVTAISNRQGWGSSSNTSWKAPRGTEKVTSHQDQRAGWFQTCNNNGFIPSLKWKLLHGAGCVHIKTKGLTCWTVGYKLTFTWGFISWISFTYKCSDPNHWTSQVLKGKSLFKISHHTTRRGNWEKKKKIKKPNTHYSSTMAFVLFLTLQRALNHLLYYNPTEKPVFLSTSKGNQGFVF